MFILRKITPKQFCIYSLYKTLQLPNKSNPESSLIKSGDFKDDFKKHYFTKNRLEKRLFFFFFLSIIFSLPL